jgi:hypothetical protein
MRSGVLEIWKCIKEFGSLWNWSEFSQFLPLVPVSVSNLIRTALPLGFIEFATEIQ